jgi:hypothetical protein
MIAMTRLRVSMKLLIFYCSKCQSLNCKAVKLLDIPSWGRRWNGELGREQVLPELNSCADNAETGQLSHWQLEDDHLHSIELAFEVS